MRWMLAIPALMIAAPALAQDQQAGLPVWEVGVWCLDIQPEIAACLTISAPANGAMTTRTEITDHGKKNLLSEAVITLEQGRVVTRSAGAGTEFREIARGPNTVTMENAIAENVANGDAKTIRFTVTGDDMTVDIGDDGHPDTVQRYKRVRQ